MAAIALAYVPTRQRPCILYLRHRVDACFLERVAIAAGSRPRALLLSAYGIDGQRCAGCDHQLTRPNDWIGAELLGLLLAVCAVLAGWAKPRWLQWVGVGGMFVQNISFFVFYTLGS